MLQAVIDVAEFRPDAGTLRAGLTINAVRVLRAGRGTARPFLNPAARFFSSLKVEDWNRQRLSLEIPLRLDREITIPDLSGDVTVAARPVPLAIRVSALTVLQDRLVLSLGLEPDRDTEEPSMVSSPD